jgi:hypothetical protein
MNVLRLTSLALPLFLLGCPSEEPDKGAQCIASCQAAGHTSGTISNDLCLCSVVETSVDAGNEPQSDSGSQPITDAGSQPPLVDGGSSTPNDTGPPGPVADAGFNNHDIGVLNPDAGMEGLSMAMRCSELCQWGFTGWSHGVDGGPGEAVECPQDRRTVFGDEDPQTCATNCEAAAGGWDIGLFRMMEECVQTTECGERAACVPAHIQANWQQPICRQLCEGIEDYRTPATACEPPRFGADCPAGCATALRTSGPLIAQGLQRCYDNIVNGCAGEQDRNACQCDAQGRCHSRDMRQSERLAWQYCSLRNTHCRGPGELPMNMVDCINMRLVEVLGHRSLPELQACFNAFDANPGNCFETLDGCLTPF